MRIFMAVRHSTNPNRLDNGLWEGNFYPALRRLGHEIVESQVDLSPASEFMQIADGFTDEERELRSQLTQRMIDEVRHAHYTRRVDLFLSYFYHSHFDPEGFEDIHRLGIPSVNFYCNSTYQFDLVAPIARKVRFAWHTEKQARPSYLRVGARPVWVQMGADPDLYHPVSSAVRRPSACFVGQRYADRDRHLARLIQSGTSVDIYGHGWSANGRASHNPVQPHLGRVGPRPGSFASYLDVVRENVRRQGLGHGLWRSFLQGKYRRETRRLIPLIREHVRGFATSVPETLALYEVVLNFSNVWADGRPGSELIPHIRLRDFEAPMCRTCYLTGYSQEIAEFYEVGKEIDTFRSADELVEKSQYYLEKPRAAERLREFGYRRALQDHTWVQRFQQLFREIGL